MVTVCPSQFATRRTLFHVLVGCGLLMLKVSRLKLPVIWLLISMLLNTLTKSQIWEQGTEIMRQMITQAQTAGQYFTNDQIKEMTRKVSAEVDLVHQQTQNKRYGSSHIGATAKDISNVVTDAASGVVDIFHGIDKAVADTWNNFWKDGKADGIGSNLSRK